MSIVKARILRRSRIIVAIVAFAIITGVLTSYGMDFARRWQVLVNIQFLPATFAFSITYLVGWMIVTLVFGRLYCSTVCPLGTLQDIFARLPRLTSSHRVYRYCAPLTVWRNTALLMVVSSVLMGVSLLTTIIDPYSIYSRFAVYCIKPLWGVILNLISSQTVVLTAASLAGMACSVVIVGIVAWMAWRNGRTFCNTVCPVGTTLGFISRYAVFHIDINTDLCIQCRKCEYVCKASCINLESHVVDSSRCVVCFDCLTVCPNDAIRYTSERHQLSIPLMRRVRNPLVGSAAGVEASQQTDARMLDRRAFLATGLVIAAAPLVEAAEKGRNKLRGGLRSGQDPVSPDVPVTPPGIPSRAIFMERCTGCGLCISHCKTGVLRPSISQYGLLRMFHPVKDYDRSYCAYNCTRCTDLCPSGALRPITREEKIRQAVGLAKVAYDKCVACGRCASACPADAIHMTLFENRGGIRMPTVDPSRCIGCGACQYVCPAKPHKAIIVNGLP